MKIFVYPRKFFESIDQGTLMEILNEAMIISINTPRWHNEKPELPPFPKQYWNDLCILYFHDYERKDDPQDILFNFSHAKQIKKFIEKFQQSDKQYICVHCTMGASRSGAVGEFLNIYFNKFIEDNQVDYSQFYKDNSQIIPNSLVKSTLMRYFELI